MTGNEYRQVIAHDATLAVGVRVDIRWTNSHRYYAMPATITKVNGKSVLAAIEAAIHDQNDPSRPVVYPAAHVIKAPRITDMQGWTCHNCVTPQGGWPVCEQE